jgi:hypothetical protein
MSKPPSPHWLSRIELLATTLVVLLIGSMMIWYEALERELRLALTIGSAVLLYVAGLVLAGRKSDPTKIAWWPFALAGLVAGAVAELINAEFLVTPELFLAAMTGVAVGTAHWIALRVWLHLVEPNARS